MAIKSSGTISMLDLVAEFGGTAPHALSEFYGKSTLPKNGKISFADFYGTSNKLPTEYDYWVNMEEITANKTFTVPAGVTSILVAAMGGGASGAWGDNYADRYFSLTLGGSGGGASAWVVGTFDVTPGQSLAVTIGAGGTITKKLGSYRGAYHSKGVAGGNTSVGSLITSSGAPAPGMILTASNWPDIVDASPAGKGVNGGGNGATGAYIDDSGSKNNNGKVGTACVSKILDHDESNSYVPPAPGSAPSPGINIKYGHSGQGGTSPYGPGSVSTYNFSDLRKAKTPDATNKGSGGGGGNHMSQAGDSYTDVWAGKPGAGAPGVVKIFWT